MLFRDRSLVRGLDFFGKELEIEPCQPIEHPLDFLTCREPIIDFDAVGQLDKRQQILLVGEIVQGQDKPQLGETPAGGDQAGTVVTAAGAGAGACRPE